MSGLRHGASHHSTCRHIPPCPQFHFLVVTGAYKYLTDGRVQASHWARHACPRGRYGKVSDAPSESRNHAYGHEERKRPLPGFLEATFSRLRLWRERRNKHIAELNRRLRPGQAPSLTLCPKAEARLDEQDKVRGQMFLHKHNYL